MSYLLRPLPSLSWSLTRRGSLISSRRGLGWLIGPEPEFNTKRWWKKYVTIVSLFAGIGIPMWIHDGRLKIDIYDQEGNFDPKVQFLSHVEIEMAKEQEKLREHMEELKRLGLIK